MYYYYFIANTASQIFWPKQEGQLAIHNHLYKAQTFFFKVRKPTNKKIRHIGKGMAHRTMHILSDKYSHGALRKNFWLEQLFPEVHSIQKWYGGKN